MNNIDANDFSQSRLEFNNQEDDFIVKGVINLQPNEKDAEIKIIPKSKHCLSFALSLLLWLGLIYHLFYLIASALDLSVIYEIEQNMQTSLVILGCTYFIYLIDVFCCSTFRFVYNQKKSDELVNYVMRIKKTRPDFIFWGECYHYETRTRLVNETYTEQTENGPRTKTRQKLETYTEKVVTHTESENFIYRTSYDDSGMISNDVNTHDVIKITFKKNYRFGNQESEWAYKNQFQYFINRNKCRDVCFDHTETFQISDFKDKILSRNTTDHSTKLTTSYYLAISLLLMCSWPYKIWLENLCYKGEFTVKKIIYA
jgi:hypothetical protein